MIEIDFTVLGYLDDRQKYDKDYIEEKFTNTADSRDL